MGFKGILRPRAAVNHITVGAAGHGAEMLGSIDYITAIPRDNGGEAHGCSASGFRFAAPTPEQLAFFHHLAEVESLPFLGGKGIYESSYGRVHVNGHPGVSAASSQTLHYLDISQHIQPETTVSHWNAHCQQPAAPNVVPTIDGVSGLGVVSGSTWGKALVGQPLGRSHKAIGVHYRYLSR